MYVCAYLCKSCMCMNAHMYVRGALSSPSHAWVAAIITHIHTHTRWHTYIHIHLDVSIYIHKLAQCTCYKSTHTHLWHIHPYRSLSTCEEFAAICNGVVPMAVFWFTSPRCAIIIDTMRSHPLWAAKCITSTPLSLLWLCICMCICTYVYVCCVHTSTLTYILSRGRHTLIPHTHTHTCMHAVTHGHHPLTCMLFVCMYVRV